ncbi:putative CDP-glycerol:glycerophosphate glycerophosphotransferase [Methanobrevibacter woesei]|uniref:Putative CDP-glycerol:glycerophosphate glycerophosphotransferase n=1 Tax=Methanobrevibacter woesei TaxID=190976 RepID=A0A2U1S6G8_9EURY|nr:CDP-glycerol glycerophosphotransferase family protein [Methanobrevibacter woesei]PWB85185.1 putative CDP-glycerol:glycerophosphate glycerophosphotransferase [Methanobrevibacter woesei]
MYFKHKIFGFIFNLFSKSKVNDNQIAFVVDDKNSFKGNFQYIKREFSKRGDFDFVFFNKNSLSISNIKKLAKSKYIFLNDNFLAIAFMNFNKDSKIFQLWHAPGAFKKFAASSSDNKEEIAVIAKASKKTDYLFITSENIKGFYRDAFRIDENKIKSFGIPRTDYYFEDKDIKKLRENFDERYPIAKNKKILLYAPTFRDNEEDNNVFNYLNLEKFNNDLSEEYVLALRLHPKINQFFKGDIDTKADFIDVSGYKNEQELMLISDLLITDYSSIMIEFALLNKPIIFFTYDYDRYLTKDRGFYYDFESNVPGDIVKTDDELIKLIKEGSYNTEKHNSFLKMQFDYLDGNSSKRIVDFILEE